MWAKAGHPPPLLMDWDRLQRSGDAFPIEILDMQDSRRVLYGEDPFPGILVSREPLRLQVEHELHGKLIHLREAFLTAGGKAKAVRALMENSLSSFLVLFRAVLRLAGEKPPIRKLDSLELLKKYVDFDDDGFRQVAALREGVSTPDVLALFKRYLKAVEVIVTAVDSSKFIIKEER
jgi:hypothetical protein